MNQYLALKDYMPLLQTLVGGVLTFLGGLLGSILIQKQQREAETKSLASAFYGEIQALVKIVDKRQYIQAINDSINTCQAGAKTFPQIRVTRKYFNVYEKNLDKIGILPNPLPENIVYIYTVMTAILEDLDSMNEEKFSEQETENVIKFLVELKSLLEDALESGQKVCQQIRSMRLLVS